jgi:hypothetical protein
MTASFKTTFRRAILMLAVAALLSSMGASTSFAFSSEAQQMCSGDAFRLCAAEIPSIPKITACMIKHRAQLSAGCRAVVDRGLAQGSSKVAEE